MKRIINSVIPIIVEMLVQALKPEQLNRVADKALDWCEVAIGKTKNELDDTLILPLISIVREAFEIEDNDPK